MIDVAVSANEPARKSVVEVAKPPVPAGIFSKIHYETDYAKDENALTTDDRAIG